MAVTTVSLFAPLAALLLFVLGYKWMHDPAPDAGMARLLYACAAASILLALATVAFIGPRRRLRLGIACVGLPIGHVLAAVAESGYGRFSLVTGSGPWFLLALVCLYIVAAGIAMGFL